MKYMLLMYGRESNVPPEELQSLGPAWAAFLKEETAAGVLVSNGGLDPVAKATTVRVRNGKTLTTDGPYAETHEQLGGYQVVECKDLDEATRWAAKIPTAKYGCIEVRLLWAPGQ